MKSQTENYLREAVYGLKEPPQEETVEIIRMSEVDTQTVEWLWKTVYPLWESNHSTGQPRRGKRPPLRCALPLPVVLAGRFRA